MARYHNDLRIVCVNAFLVSLRQSHTAIIVLNFRVVKFCVYFQVINVPSTAPDQRDEISKGS
jgi:hypothetical protein